MLTGGAPGGCWSKVAHDITAGDHADGSANRRVLTGGGRVLEYHSGDRGGFYGEQEQVYCWRYRRLLGLWTCFDGFFDFNHTQSLKHSCLGAFAQINNQRIQNSNVPSLSITHFRSWCSNCIFKLRTFVVERCYFCTQ